MYPPQNPPKTQTSFFHNIHVEIFVSYFQQNCDVHHYDTRTAQHYHIPPVKFDLAKTGIRYRGAVVWNAILSDNTNTNVSEAVFKKVLKRLLSVGILY